MQFLRRFFVEVYDDDGMYDDFLRGEVILDNEKVMNWTKTMRLRNREFATSIKDFNRVYPKTKIIESAIGDGLSVSEFLYNKSEVTTSDFGKFEIGKKTLGDDRSHYICNGWFLDTLDNIYKVLEKGSFTVGICCEKKTDLYRDVKTQYNKLKDFLMRNGYMAGSVEKNCGTKDRVYLLMYDSMRNKKVGR